ncbi:MAG TPA: cbb3-type cytochrome c oxidase subunit I [Anaerolineales bacterium]|nr:cbb3-type cytochrome c oxidase subunit I [Anaerolineales bacterium]
MRKFFSLGLVRGLIWQVIGTAFGIGLVTGVRALMRLPAWKAEPAVVVGALFGALFFLYGVGVLDDWLKWANGEETSDEEVDETGLGRRRYFGASQDHKVIGIQYLTLALILFTVGGTFALIFRTELVKPGMQFLTPLEYNTLMSLHGIVMIVGILIGISAFMNYTVPLLIGARDMAFPRLNAFSFWIAVPAGIILLSSLFLGGFDTGWTGYPPLSVRAPLGMQMFFLGVSLSSFSSILSALNILATVIRLRAKGMTPFRLPIFVWAAIATSIISLTATQLIGLAFQMVMLERLLGMGFFDPVKGGNPVLFEHLFWFYSHPAVYVFVLPGLGVISELLPVFVRKPLYGYKWVAMSSLGIALTGFLVWGHHMFASGMAEYLREPFMYSTLLVAVPTGVKFFSWVATIWKGKISFPTPMLFVLGGIVVFLLGGLSGPPNATVSTDLLLNNTYYIVGHFHDTLFGGYVFPFFASIYYWWPKMTGKRLNEKLGKLHFWLMGPGMLILTLAMMRVGLLGMRRRVADYDPALGFQSYHIAMTLSGYLVALSILIFFINVFLTMKRGEVALGNVWGSRSPEWQVASPMPVHNYDKPVVVVGEPYDYGLPGSRYVKFEGED